MKKMHSSWLLPAVGCLIAFGACEAERAAEPTPAGMPNPASVHCIQVGGTLTIRKLPDGGEVGTCVFEDGTECEEWALFRKECEPGGG